jgi:hypothetical protein
MPMEDSIGTFSPVHLFWRRPRLQRYPLHVNSAESRPSFALGRPVIALPPEAEFRVVILRAAEKLDHVSGRSGEEADVAGGIVATITRRTIRRCDDWNDATHSHPKNGRRTFFTNPRAALPNVGR